MARKNTLSRHSNPLNRELRYDTGAKLKRLRVKKFGGDTNARVTAALTAGMDPSQLDRYERAEALPTLTVLYHLLSCWESNWKEFHE